MRLLYIISLFNPNNLIKSIEFLEEEIKLIFHDDTERRFCFHQVDEGDGNIYNNISRTLDSVLKVHTDFNNDNNDNNIRKIKYEELCVLRNTISMESIEGNIFIYL
jgi:hypothetical protein